MRRILASIIAVFLLGACGGDGTTPPTSPPTATPAITLSMSSSSVLAQHGSTATVQVSIARVNGATGPVTLAVEGMPANVTGAFLPNPIADASTTSTLTLTVGAAAAVGTSTVTVRATAVGVAEQTASMSVTVAAPPAFSLTATNVPVSQGSIGVSAVVITRTGGFTGPVTLSTANVPANITVTYGENPATTGNATVSFTAGAGAVPGVYTVTLNGAGAGVATQSTMLTLTVTALGGAVNYAWRFCDPGRVPVWFAYRDGTAGAWTRVTVSGGNTFNFTLIQSVGAVAYVVSENGQSSTDVFYGSRLELQNSLTLECLNNPVAGKTLNGSVIGLSATETASIFHGSADGSAAPGALIYQLQNVESGALDLFAVRVNTTVGPPVSSTLNRMFLQRNVNVAAGGTLPLVDFTGGASFAPATATITIANAGSDQLLLANIVQFASGTEAYYVPQPLAAGATRTFFGIPTPLLASGDLHAALILASSANNAVNPPTQDQRFLYSYFRTVADRTLTLGPALASVTLTSSTAGGLARPKAKANFQTEYADAFGVTFSQNSGNRVITISATRGYFAAGSSEFELETPNLAGIDGFNLAWGLVAGVSTEAQVTAMGGFAGLFNLPMDGTSWRVAARGTSFIP